MLSTLTSLGLNENQAKVRLAVWQYRLSPASQIGALTNMERTHAYKILLQLQEKNLIASSLRGKTSYFYVPDKDVLRSLLERQYEELKSNEEKLENLETELDTLINPELSLTPPLRQWAGVVGVEEGLNDCLKTCQTNGIRQLYFFGSKTLESIATSTETLGQKRKYFFDMIQKNDIYLEGFEGTGMLMLEQIMNNIPGDEIKMLPTGSHALQMIIVGIHIYYIIYRREPIMLKITSPEMAELMRVLLKK